MTRRGTRRPAAPGADLLAHAERDLVGCVVVRGAGDTAVVRPPAGPAFEVEVRREHRKLIDLRVLAIHVHGPATDVADAAIVLHHRGQVRRTGLAGKVRGREAAAIVALRDHLLGDGELDRAARPLDFTRFEVRNHDGAWRATLELMGASYVRTTFPPSAHYVRLDAEQLDALLATVGVLHARLPGREPAPAPAADHTTPAAAHTTPAAARPTRDHLPRSDA